MVYQSTTGLEHSIWLSDRGVAQATEAGLIRNIHAQQIQPATIDLASKCDITLGPFQRRMVEYDSPELDPLFETFGDIRSRVRRKGLHAHHAPKTGGFVITNPMAQAFSLSASENFAQMYIGGSPESELADFDHGNVLVTTKQVGNVVKEGLIRHSNSCPTVQDGFLVFHASENAKLITVNPLQQKKATASNTEYEPLKIPSSGIQLGHNKQYFIALTEEIELSPYTALQFFYLNEYGRLELNGVGDPGFTGGISVPFLINDSHHVKKGDPIALARVIHYKNGVQKPYGDQRGSTFQNCVFSSI